ncbi:Lead, cadmium, zinc and mercury transporting ATPase 3B Copper-translocating P-type ATPase [Pseudomonas viridiflava]|nr:Lead, cadmium, zinc and mercury transporting ATPase 3B Copper-translocating P-type ATPase [Pseudomonas viridiflava]
MRRMPFWTLRVLLTTQSVETCIPTLERAERSSQLSCDALRRMPFRTLCVLLRPRTRLSLLLNQISF